MNMFIAASYFRKEESKQLNTLIEEVFEVRAGRFNNS
jgi:hypothetical protein